MAGLVSKCDVLVTYCWNRVGYNILRSLNAHGLKVYAADTSKRNICSMSKFCAGNFIYPDPFTQEEKFISCLLENIERLKPRVLMPTHDEGLVIAKHIDRFPKWLQIPIESFDKLTSLTNKALATSIAEKAGVPIPRVYGFNEPVSNFPVVLKTVIGNSAKGVHFPENEAELESLKQKYTTEEILIEEKIGGTDYSVDCARWIGQNSLYFLAIHCPLKGFVVVVIARLLQLEKTRIIQENMIYSLVTFVVTMLFSSVIVILIQKWIRFYNSRFVLRDS